MRFSLTCATSTFFIATGVSSGAWAQLAPETPPSNQPVEGPAESAGSSAEAPPEAQTADPPPAQEAPPPEASVEPAQQSTSAESNAAAEPAVMNVSVVPLDDEDCDEDEEDCDEDEDDEDEDEDCEDEEDCDEDDCDEDEDEDCDEDENEDEDEPDDGPRFLFDDEARGSSFGGYYGFTMDSSWFGGRPGLLLGSEGGVILNHGLVLGGAMRALWTPVEGPPLPAEGGNGGFRDSSLALMYGGFMMRFQMVGDGPIYGSFGALIGGGGVTLVPRIGNSDRYLWTEDQDGDGFFVFEPQLQGHVNLTKWARFTVNASYRWVHGVDYEGVSERHLRGLSVGGAIQVGWF